MKETALPKNSISTQSYPQSPAPSLSGMRVPESPLNLAGLNINPFSRLSSADLQPLHLLHARGSFRVSLSALLLYLLQSWGPADSRAARPSRCPRGCCLHTSTRSAYNHLPAPCATFTRSSTGKPNSLLGNGLVYDAVRIWPEPHWQGGTRCVAVTQAQSPGTWLLLRVWSNKSAQYGQQAVTM